MKIMKHISLVFIGILSILLISTSCSNESNLSEEQTNKLLEVSSEQFVSEKMEIGSIEDVDFKFIIRLNGQVFAQTNAISQVSTPIGGIVENINFEHGETIKKGQILFYLYSNELIEKQQEFAETSIKLEKLKSDFERIKNLVKEKIMAEKELITATSEFKSTQIKYESLKIQLSKLNLNPEQIEKGKYYSSIPIKAPVSGTIIYVDVVNGQYVESNIKLIEIIDIHNLELKLSAFEKDLPHLKEKQEIEYHTLNNPDQKNTAFISKIGNSINPNTAAIDVYAKPDKIGNTNPVNSAAIEALVNTGSRKVKALPETAIMKSENRYYIYVVSDFKDNKYFLDKVEVSIGQKHNGFVEITKIPEVEKIIIKGLDNLSIE